MALEKDLIRLQSAAVAYAAFGLLGLIAVGRYPAAVDWGSPRTLIFLTGPVVAAAGGIAVATLAIRRLPA